MKEVSIEIPAGDAAAEITEKALLGEPLRIKTSSGYDAGTVVMAHDAMYYVGRSGALVKFASRSRKSKWAWVPGDRPGDAELLQRIVDEAVEHVASKAEAETEKAA